MSSDTDRRTFLQGSLGSVAALTTWTVALSDAASAETESAGGKTAYLCVACGTQFTESSSPPEHCPICEDERQFIPPEGQQWTTPRTLRKTHKVIIRQEEENLYSLNAEPKLGIGQRAFLIRTPEGNVLWDCIAAMDDAATARISELGGIHAIAISHPHYYSNLVDWSRAFGNAPVHLPERDRQWVMRPDPCIRFWEDRPPTLPGGLRLVRTGGHFEGYQVLHWPDGAEGRGVLMAGDQPQICMDPKQVSFMYSYPNFIPLNAPTIRHIVECLEPLPFDRIYGAFFIRGKGIVPTQGKDVVRRSSERYLRAIQG